MPTKTRSGFSSTTCQAVAPHGFLAKALRQLNPLCNWWLASKGCDDPVSQGHSCYALGGCDYQDLVNLTKYEAYILVTKAGRALEEECDHHLYKFIKESGKPFFVVVNHIMPIYVGG